MCMLLNHSLLVDDPNVNHDIYCVDSICIGSGRFLRSVLVPALNAAEYHPIVFQTRGRSFLEYTVHSAKKKDTANNFFTYEVDTVQFEDGTIVTDHVKYYGAGTLGPEENKMKVLDFLLNAPFSSSCEKQPQQRRPFIIGLGVTEAGLVNSSTKIMKYLFNVLMALSKNESLCATKICIINTDNVSQNGDVIRRYMMELATDAAEKEFLKESVVFHNTMVDRITSARPDSDGFVPRAEPIPAKALVVEDLNQNLPSTFSSSSELKDKYGVVVRTKPNQLNADIALKLRIANGTHTAIAHAMALSKITMTDVLSSSSNEISKLLMKYLDSFFYNQILVGIENTKEFVCTKDDAIAVYKDWRKRLIHGYFGLSTFFITQNGASKGGIRFGPTIKDLIQSNKPVTCSTVFALAALLRFLTPKDGNDGSGGNGIQKGWLEDTMTTAGSDSDSDYNSTVAYADFLAYNLKEEWYEFRCTNKLMDGKTLVSCLASCGGCTKKKKQPIGCESVVNSYLISDGCGNLGSLKDHPSFKVVVKAVSTLYARMIADDGIINIMKELDFDANCDVLVDGTLDDDRSDRPLHYKKESVPTNSNLMNVLLARLSSSNDRYGNYRIGNDTKDRIRSIVYSEVSSAIAVDLHTHLLPPTHGSALCLWGIDELLTYHYLVAEYFMTAPPQIVPEEFYSLTKQKQADIIWKALFVERSPISEACRGVITVLVALGLRQQIYDRDLNAIREFYNTNYRDDGIEGAERFSKFVYDTAGVSYAVMTNIPFEPTETQHWRPTPKEYSSNFRSACRVDPLLAGNKAVVEDALKAAGYDTTIEGAKRFLHDWCDTMKPEYMMASTPHDFVLPEDKGTIGNSLANDNNRNNMKIGVNEDAMKVPFAFADVVATESSRNATCGIGGDGGEELASIIDEDSDFLSEVLMKVCEERDLPIALKIGAHRKVNPSLGQAGDGLVAFADGGMLARLCTRFPKVRFLATFLSRTNQHEACVLATKFRNLHLYGCWWFCNNPSIIREITTMRVEMLGTAFTAQHSDSRVLDQLLYKWPHSRAVIASVLADEYTKLIESGWSFTRGELRRDVQRLFGRSYEEFMAKSLILSESTGKLRVHIHTEQKI